MLPGSCRPGIANGQRLTRFDGSYSIRNNAVGSPVMAPNHIPGSRRGNAGGLATLKKGSIVRVNRNFTGRLRGTVGILSAQRINLAVAILPFPVLIALVSCNQHRSTNGGTMPDSLKH